MTVSVNGRPQDLPEGTTVADLVDRLAAPGRGTAVAVAGEVLPRGQWRTRRLSEGDVVELLVAVQGG